MNSAGDMFGVLHGKRFGSEMAWAIRKKCDRVGGRVRVQKQAVKGPGLHWGIVSVLWPAPLPCHTSS